MSRSLLRPIVLFIIALSLGTGCDTTTVSNHSKTYSGQVLDSIRRASDPVLNPSNNTDRALALYNAYQVSKSNKDFLEYCKELVRAGQYTSAIQSMQSVFPDGTMSIEYLKSETKPIFETQGIGYMMLALENYKKPITFPIEDRSGINTEYAEAATHFFKMLMHKFPGKPQYKYWLNLCHMMMGDYPKALNDEDRMDFKAFYGLSDIKFTLETPVQSYDRGGASILVDLNKDGECDLVNTTMGLTQDMQVYRQNNGQLSSADAGVADLKDGFHASLTDYNNDGLEDVFITRGAHLYSEGKLPNSLLKNRGNGQLEDMTADLHLMQRANSVSSAWADYNNDGFLDVYVANEVHKSHAPSSLYKNSQGKRFVDVTRATMDEPFDKNAIAATWVDVDDDADMDLIVVSNMTQSKFYENVDGRLVPSNKLFLFRSRASDIVNFDMDNDGDEDIFYSAYQIVLSSSAKGFGAVAEGAASKDCKMYLNNGKGNFEPLVEAGDVNQLTNILAAVPFDADNDGYVDLFLIGSGRDNQDLAPTRLLRNMGGTHFEEVSINAHAAVLSKVNGVALADIDNDGDVDLYLEGGGFYEGDKAASMLLRNSSSTDNKWIKIQLQGKTNNRPGVGAKLTLIGQDDTGAKKQIVRTVSLGHHLYTAPADLPIGVGTMSAVDSLIIRWPNGLRQVATNLATNQKHVVAEK